MTTSTPVVVGAAPSKSEPAAARPGMSRGWAHVAVDTSQTGEAGPAIRRRVQERADVVLRRAGVMPGRGPQDPTINVVIREVGGDKPGWEYVITVTDADRPKPKGTPQSCSLCTETELVDAIEGRLARIAAELETAAESDEVDERTPPVEPPIDEPPPPDPRKLGPKGKAGAALVAVGGAGLVTGIVLAVLAPQRPVDGDYSRERTTRPPGYALLGAGAAILIVGAVLLGIDRRQARRRSSARVQPLPGLGLRF